MGQIVIELTKEWVASKLPERPKSANKGTFGKVLVAAGSKNYPGAAYLCCAAAYRVGAGLVTLATIPLVQNIVSRKLPEVTFIVLPDENIYEELYDYDVILIGPGLGRENAGERLINKLFGLYDLPPIVIDGDGLNILSEIKNWWEEIEKYGIDLVLTPHPGEMSRLTGLSIEEIQKNRESIAKKYAADTWGQVVVLKGANTVNASPSGEVAVSPFANPALATAGTGDILSGMIAGFIAQGLSLFDAAGVGVYIHGLAGEILSKQMGDVGTKASDLLPFLPQAIQKLK